MRVQTITNGRWRENCHLVSADDGATVIIDPGTDVDLLADALDADLRPVAMLATHGHYDHVAATAALQKRYPVPFYLHSGDTSLVRYVNLYMRFFDGLKPVQVPEVHDYFDKVPSPLVLGGLEIEVIPTPGHTPGSVCFRVDDHLFTGDTLMKKGVGRLDLPGSDPEQLKESLRRLGEMPPNLAIHPGHGPSSTIGAELRDNPHLKEVVS